tara:strand:- start:2108 stop:2314 length:207 start_codon:yes stop_codon:yes gene_type:complete
MKKIELEADNFVKTKSNKFNTGLNKEVQNLNSYILNNLLDCREKERARERLMEAKMWARLAADRHGIK